MESFGETAIGLFEFKQQFIRNEVQIDRLREAASRHDLMFSTWWFDQHQSCYLPKFIKGIWLEKEMKGEYLCIKEQLWAIAEELAEKPTHE